MSSPKSRGTNCLHSFVGLFAAFCLFACTKSGPKAPTAEVNLAIWGNYLSAEARERFAKETGLKLNVTTYSSNEELLAKVQTGAASLDVAVPSDYMVDVMTKLELLEPLKLEQIPNARDVEPEFLKPSYDPENKYSLPFAWAMSGLAVNREVYKDEINSWQDLFENPKLVGKFALMDDVREVIAAALLRRGFDVNTTNQDELNQVKEDLLKIRKNVKLFTSDTIDILKNKEVMVAHAYSSDALQAQAATSGQIEFILPKEGSTRYVDNVVILKGAKNPENAHKLLNFFLSQSSNIEFVNAIRAGPVIKGVREKLPEDLKNNKALFPTKEAQKNLKRITDLGEKNKLYEDIWTTVKTAR